MQKEERIPIVLKLLLLLVLFFNNETLSNNLCTFVKQPTQYVSALLIVYFLYYIITHREVLRAFNRNAFILVTLFTIFIPVSYMRDSGFTNGYILLILAVMSAFSLSIMLEFGIILFLLCANIAYPLASLKLLLIVCATTALIYLFVNTKEKPVIFVEVISYIGRASFSIYLCHQIVVAYMYYAVTDRSDPYVLMIFIAVVFLLSVVIYLMVEKPLELVVKKNVLYVLVPSVAVCLITSAISGMIYLHAGVVRDVPELGIEKANVHRGMHAEYCDIPYSWDKDFESTDKVKIAVIGDSFGRDWAMQSKGIESFVACPDLASLSENGYKIGNKLDWKFHALLSRITGKQGYFSRFATKGLLYYISEVKPDVIHLRNLHSNYINLPMLLKYIAEKDIATVLTLHDSWFYTGKCVYYIECNCDRWENRCGNCPALKAGNPSLFLDRTTEMLADKKKLFSAIRRLAVVGVSQWVTDDASKSILKDSAIVQCIYNWIDLERFQPRDCRELKKSMGIENKFVILGIAMSWIPQKGINLFHDLADLLPDDCQIVLVGDDSEVTNKHPKIEYLGTIKDVDLLAKLYAMADVFVNPTIQETFGKTTAEAMACGTPVVAYNGTATPELVGSDGSCGYLIDENDARLYCDKILQIKMKAKSTFSKATRSRAEKLFSKDKNIQMYFEIYERLLKNERSVRK